MEAAYAPLYDSLADLENKLISLPYFSEVDDAEPPDLPRRAVEIVFPGIDFALWTYPSAQDEFVVAVVSDNLDSYETVNLAGLLFLVEQIAQATETIPTSEYIE